MPFFRAGCVSTSVATDEQLGTLARNVRVSAGTIQEATRLGSRLVVAAAVSSCQPPAASSVSLRLTAICQRPAVAAICPQLRLSACGFRWLLSAVCCGFLPAGSVPAHQGTAGSGQTQKAAAAGRHRKQQQRAAAADGRRRKQRAPSRRRKQRAPSRHRKQQQRQQQLPVSDYGASRGSVSSSSSAAQSSTAPMRASTACRHNPRSDRLGSQLVVAAAVSSCQPPAASSVSLRLAAFGRRLSAVCCGFLPAAS